MRKHGYCAQKGFMLVEIVIVIIILAVLAVVATAKFAKMPPLRLELAAKRLQSDIRYAQSLATSIQKRTRIYFNAVNETYTVYIRGGGSWKLAVDPLTRENFQVQLNQDEFVGIEIKSVDFKGTPNLVFNKWGKPFGSSEPPFLPLILPGTARLSAGGIPADLNVSVEGRTGRVFITPVGSPGGT